MKSIIAYYATGRGEGHVTAWNEGSYLEALKEAVKVLEKKYGENFRIWGVDKLD